MLKADSVTPRRVLIATDLPVWRSSTGAEQRVLALVHYLQQQHFQVQIVFIGEFNGKDRQNASEAKLDVQFRNSSMPPDGVMGKAKWWMNAVWNRFGTGQRSSPSTKVSELCLADFRWPWAIAAFAQCVKEFRPNAIIFEYVKMSYLLEALSAEQRTQTLCVIDTHDVQHLRADEFRKHGHGHWLAIDRDTEANTLAKFDLMVAIQEEEAKVFRELVPNVKTIVCGHSPDTEWVKERSKENLDRPGELRVGYLGSANASNVDAIKRFFIDAWIPNLDRVQSAGAKLIIGGQVCRALHRDPEWQPTVHNPSARATISLLGPIDSLTDFYDQIDVAINPVEFGAGLKIKNAEAVAFGKPLITTPHGILGMSDEMQKLTVVRTSPIEILDQLIEWSADRKNLAAMSENARLAAGHPETTYRELIEALRG